MCMCKSSTSYKRHTSNSMPIDIIAIIETTQLECGADLATDISVLADNTGQPRTPVRGPAARQLKNSLIGNPGTFSRRWYARACSTKKSRWQSSAPLTPSSHVAGARGSARRERPHPHVGRHDQVLLVVKVQLAERRISSRACQVDAEVVRVRAAVWPPHAAKNRLGEGT